MNSLTDEEFCVSATEITAATGEGACANSDDPIPLTLGEDGVLTFDSIETASLYTQLSTNASDGARVFLKSYALNCGGLYLGTSTADNCHIKPAVGDDANMVADQDDKADEEQSAFGVMITPGTTIGDGALFAPEPLSVYTDNSYNMNFVTGNATGVTSTFGDAFMRTSGVTSSRTAELTFGATINNQTPAGTYTTILSLIASGKF